MSYGLRTRTRTRGVVARKLETMAHVKQGTPKSSETLIRDQLNFASLGNAGYQSVKNPGFPAPGETESWRPQGKARKLHTDAVETLNTQAIVYLNIFIKCKFTNSDLSSYRSSNITLCIRFSFVSSVI